jgi:hypothetical protein
MPGGARVLAYIPGKESEMSYKVTVVWLSRHAMTEDQKESLLPLLGVVSSMEGWSIAPLRFQPDDLEIKQISYTFPARSGGALDALATLVGMYPGAVFTGVFPAHIAAAIARDRCNNRNLLPPVFVPVSVPRPAAAGEVRGGGLVHSHWERL